MPDWCNVRAFDGLEAELEKQLEAARPGLISFDVFDTLVKRRCAPETVVRGVAVAIRQAMPADNRPSLERILAERHAAYVALAEANRERGLDPETTLQPLCRAWVERISPEAGAEQHERLAAIAFEAERRYERWACMPNPVMLDLCRRLAAEGHRMVYTSDMYLGGDIVGEILDECGFGGVFAAGYVSADHSLLKRSGRLFACVAERERVEAAMILHIGDDRHSDGRMATASGLRSIVIRDRREMRRRNRAFYDHYRLGLDGQWAGVVAADYAAAGADPDEDPALTIGRDLLGPQLMSFIHHLADYCQQHAIERVYFLSREGYVLRAMYDELVDTLEAGVPRGSYLCVSRISSSLGSMGDHFGLREINAAMSANALVTPRRIVAPLDFPENELLDLASSCGLEDVDMPLGLHDSPAFSRFLSHPRVSARAREIGRRGRAALHAYLRKQGFFEAERVAIVDVGWGAQIQENLEIAVQELPDAPQIHGVYLGANRLTVERRRSGLRASAALTDASSYEWCGGAAFDFVQAYEVATRAPHGTVLGYQDGKPLLAAPGSPERGCEDADDARIARLQRGMLDSARQYARCLRMLGGRALSTRRYGRNLACRMVRFPRRGESSFFITFNNVSNFGCPETLPLGKQQAWWRPLAFMRAVNGSLWSEGVARAGMGYPGAIALSVLKARRISRLLPPRQQPDEGIGQAEAKRSAGLAATRHDFETELDRHWQQLAEQAPESSAGTPGRDTGSAAGPLSVTELMVMWLTHRLAGLYLALRRARPLAADLMPPALWLQRAVYGRHAPQVRWLLRQWRRLGGGAGVARPDTGESSG